MRFVKDVLGENSFFVDKNLPIMDTAAETGTIRYDVLVVEKQP